MGNVLRVFKRDVLRLLKVPPALVVVVALLVLPSVYAWYNVVGFWNPYDNTGNLRVCVVNEDAGASSELTGELHVGDMIVEELRENEQLDWAFVDRATAMDELDAGASYAAFVIPEDFTERLLSLTTGDFVQPELAYYVNEKTGPVAPKITDTGASTLDETINSTFVSTVSDVAVGAVDRALAESNDALDASKARAAVKVAGAVQAISEARATLDGIVAATDEAQAKAAGSKDALGRAREDIAAAGDALAAIANLTSQLQGEAAELSAAMPAVNKTIRTVSEASAKANGAVGMTAAAGEAQAGIGATIAQGRAAAEESKALAAQVRQAAQALPEGDAAKEPLVAVADALDQRAADAQATLDALDAANRQAGDLARAVSQAGTSFDGSVQGAADAAGAYADGLFGDTVPTVNRSLAQLSAVSSSLAAAVSNQRLLIDQTELAIGQLTSTLVAAREALGQTDGILADLEESLSTVQTDVLSLGESGALAKAFGEDGLDAAKIADFMGSPTELVTEQLYELNAYGSAMAPLFMNLTFWIGAFMLLVIMKQEVDGEGVRKLTVTQRYLGRFLLLAAMAVLQAAICCAGVLAIGVQAANAPALFFAAIVASLSYLSIIYALSLTLRHNGKGICIVLVYAQIPGATGLYPIEMTSGVLPGRLPVLPLHLTASPPCARPSSGSTARSTRTRWACWRCSSRCPWPSASSCGRSWRTSTAWWPARCGRAASSTARTWRCPRARIARRSCSGRCRTRRSTARELRARTMRFARWYPGTHASSAGRLPSGSRCPSRSRWCSPSRPPRRCGMARGGVRVPRGGGEPARGPRAPDSGSTAWRRGLLEPGAEAHLQPDGALVAVRALRQRRYREGRAMERSPMGTRSHPRCAGRGVARG